jgi:immune inhibitor A
MCEASSTRGLWPCRPQPVPPSPQVLKAMREEFDNLILSASPSLRAHVRMGEARRRTPGFSDGIIYPPQELPAGLLAAAPALAPASPGPVRGVIRIIVLLLEFSDQKMTTPVGHFQELLFSDGTYATGSLCDYYTQASYGQVLIAGEIHGPYTLPEPYSYYTNGESGTGMYPHNAQRMAEDALALADAEVNFAPFDPNGDGYVDALILIHAGPGAETIPSADRVNHIWSHKWTMSHRLTLDGVNLYAYLTVPEDGRLGVFAHELGHLLFQWPDLYDTDYSSAGLGNWCIMSGGSWNNGGDTPALPCAWCKMNQGWADTAVAVGRQTVALPRSADHQRIWKLWKSGLPQTEYFLIENRQKHGFDAYLPGAGLLIYHIDETQPANTGEPHYKVALVQADGQRDLEENADGGDDGDPYPGATNNRVFDANSRPSSVAYSGAPSGVAVRDISDPGLIMSATLDVGATTMPPFFPPLAGGAVGGTLLAAGAVGVTPPAPGSPGASLTAGLPRRDLTEVAGIGKARAARLQDLGIRGLAELAMATPEALARSLGVSLATAGEYIAAARILLSH